MNRASLTVISLTGLVFWSAQSGCVSRGEYDALYASNLKCEEDRNKLDGDLKAATARLEEMQKDKAFWLSERDSRIVSLNAQIQKAAADLDARDERIRQLLAALDEASKRPPDVVIEGPALAPEVDEALKKFAADNPGLVEYDASRGLVRFSTDILFELGSFTLKPNMLKQLNDFAAVISIPAAQQYDVLVVGHTDTVRVARPATVAVTPTNWHLSVYRAVSVVQELEKAKVGKTRLGAMGFGDTRLRVNRQGNVPENRRVEIFLVPKGAVHSTE